MPEYSTPTLTPAGTSKLTGMNGSSAGNFLVSDILDIIRNTYGQANGVATLDGSGKLPTAQLPDIADDVLVYASKALLPAQGVEAKIYITTDDNVLYRWDATLGDYVQLSVDLSDYATLDDLAAEESARETADTNLKNAITSLDHRVQNLEQSKGDYVVANYKDGSITPSGKGNWAVVEGLRGVSRVENSLIPTNRNTGSYTASSDTASYDETAHFLSSTEIQCVSGHTYLMVANVTRNISTNNQLSLIMWPKNMTGNAAVVFANGESNGQKCSLYTANGNGYFERISFNDYNGKRGFNAGDSASYSDLCFKDLNIYFGTSDLSFLGATDSAKLATIQKDYPHLLIPSEYGTRIVDAGYSGVRAWARNLAQTNPTFFDSPYIPTFDADKCYKVTAGVTYYWKIFEKTFTTYRARLFFYDMEGNPLTTPSTSWVAEVSSNGFYVNGQGLLWGGNASDTTKKWTFSQDFYIRFCFVMGDSSASSVISKFCINVSDSLNGTYTPYHAPNTLSLTFTGKSAGSVADTCEPNVEVEGVARKRETQRIAEYTITGNETWGLSSTVTSGVYCVYFNVSGIKPVDVAIVGNILCSEYLPVSANNTYTKVTGISVRDNSEGFRIFDPNIQTVDAMKAKMVGKKIYYEKATPTVTLSDPLIENTLLTEAYGRMATVQTGTVVDGSFDMGFITL